MLFIFFHIFHFTTKWVQIGAADAYSSATCKVDGEMIPVAPWNMMVTTFSPANWWTLIIYLGAVAIVALHVGHGVWSALQTMGWIRESDRLYFRDRGAIAVRHVRHPTAVSGNHQPRSGGVLVREGCVR